MQGQPAGHQRGILPGPCHRQPRGLQTTRRQQLLLSDLRFQALSVSASLATSRRHTSTSSRFVAGPSLRTISASPFLPQSHPRTLTPSAFPARSHLQTLTASPRLARSHPEVFTASPCLARSHLQTSTMSPLVARSHLQALTVVCCSTAAIIKPCDCLLPVYK